MKTQNITGFKLGVSKGNMKARLLGLLSILGVPTDFSSRQYTIPVKTETIREITLINSKEVPSSLMKGVIDVGITGLDRLKDSGFEKDLVVLAELPIGKNIDFPVKVVMFCQDNRDPEEIKCQKHILVHSEYPHYTQCKLGEYFPEHRVVIKHVGSSDSDHLLEDEKIVLIIPMDGGTEQKISCGEGDFGICVTESGASLRDNKLKIAECLLISPQVVIARKKHKEYSCFAKALQAALNPERKCILKFNLRPDQKQNLAGIVPFLPAAKSPTIGNLFSGGISVETEIPNAKFLDTYVRLLAAGIEACGIIKISADAAM